MLPCPAKGKGKLLAVEEAVDNFMPLGPVSAVPMPSLGSWIIAQYLRCQGFGSRRRTVTASVSPTEFGLQVADGNLLNRHLLSESCINFLFGVDFR